MKLNTHFQSVLFALAVLPLAASAELPTNTKSSQADAGLYSGGGIRGALSNAPDGWLVTSSEAVQFKGEQAFDEPPALRARAMVPLIDILKPTPVTDFKVKAPFSISVQFKNLSDAAIDPSTFKVMYGTFKVDITNRITKFVKVTKEGFTLDNAQIPAGKHRLILQVQDDKQRMAERELKVEVE